MTTQSKRRALLVGLFAVAFCFFLWFTHGTADFLVVDEPPDDSRFLCLAIWGHVCKDDPSFDAAARWQREAPSRRILLVVPPTDRLASIGLLPSLESQCRERLTACGVPQECIQTVPSEGRNEWAAARAIRSWMAESSDPPLLVLTSRLRSAHFRNMLDAVLDPAQAARVRIWAFSYPRQIDETNWWTSRSGFKVFGSCWLMLLHGWCIESRPSPPALDADDYERRFMRDAGGPTP